jgi:hypothetical protein
VSNITATLARSACQSAPVAGYSGTPLAKKLGIQSQSVVALIGAPEGVITGLPEGVEVRRQVRGHADVVVAFYTARSNLAARIGPLGAMVFPAGGLWIAWPKKAAKVATDITEDVVREVALPLGLVDNKVGAVDDTWSGLRLVWRKERR